MNWKGINITFPTFPTQSLYGPFPTLPTLQVQIPNPIALPGWIASMVGYYGDAFNIPYNNPPTEPIIAFNIPNLLTIPAFLADIFLWVLGWIGASFEWTAKSLTYILTTPSLWIIDTLNSAVQTYISYISNISKPLGIFAPVIMTLAIGAMILAMFTFALGVFKILEKVIP